MVPDGVIVRQLQPHRDHRGSLSELFRNEWALPIEPVQWNVLTSGAEVLRGLHVHLVHTDYVTIVSGHMLLALCDMRANSTTPRLATTVELSENDPACVVIPPGVAHAFYYREPSITMQAVSHTWDPADELGCRWDDPHTGLTWPNPKPIVSERDQAMGSYDELVKIVQHSAQTATASPA